MWLVQAAWLVRWGAGAYLVHIWGQQGANPHRRLSDIQWAWGYGVEIGMAHHTVENRIISRRRVTGAMDVADGNHAVAPSL